MTGEEAQNTLKKRYAYQNEYNKQNYDRITVALKKGTKEKIKQLGYKPNTLINELLENFLMDHE